MNHITVFRYAFRWRWWCSTWVRCCQQQQFNVFLSRSAFPFRFVHSFIHVFMIARTTPVKQQISQILPCNHIALLRKSNHQHQQSLYGFSFSDFVISSVKILPFKQSQAKTKFSCRKRILTLPFCCSNIHSFL